METKGRKNGSKLKNISIEDDFWNYYQGLVMEKVIPYQEKILRDQIPSAEKSHAIGNFEAAAGLRKEDFYGLVFQDSDLAKWLEGVGNALGVKKDRELRERADAVIEIIRKAQDGDGYLNTYFQIREPEKKWENLLECHELYCAGHMIEAGISYYEGTGDPRLLEVGCRLADHIDSRFGKGKIRGIPGHEEIELALLRLYRTTGEIRYKSLAEYFLNERGTEPNYFTEEKKKRDWDYWPMDPEDRKYSQNHKPVREQDTAEGHSVRAMYLYTAMADLAVLNHDEEMAAVCRKIWRNMVDCRMYVTGGIGSTADGEAFTVDYDLPNDTGYAETCASVGAVFFAGKMLEIEKNGEYADIMELELYNTILAGMQHDGTKFFYVNPLEVVPGISGELPGYKHVVPQRPRWYACACCPPNVTRLLTSLGKYIWDDQQDICYLHLFAGGTYQTENSHGLRFQAVTSYPWDGDMKITIAQGTGGCVTTMAVRIPGWCRSYTLKRNSDILETTPVNGYLYISQVWKEGDVISIHLEMPVRLLYANSHVRENSGMTAVARGPLVYCLEEADNGKELYNLRIDPRGRIRIKNAESPETDDYIAIEAKGYREQIKSKSLYTTEAPVKEPVTLKFVPYHLWGNRTPGEMRVWVKYTAAES